MSDGPTYLKQRAGVWYVHMKTPGHARHEYGDTRSVSLKTRDHSQALRARHAVIARLQAQHEKAKATPAPTAAEAIALQAEGVRAGKVHPEDFEGEVEHFLSRAPRDADGEPVLTPSELRLIRRAKSLADGGVPLLDELAAQWLKLEATRGVKQATVAERRAHLQRLQDFAGADAVAGTLDRRCAVGFAEDVLNPLPLSLERKQFILATARRFCDWLEVKGLIPSNAFDKVGLLLRADDTSREDRQIWTGSQLKRFLQEVKSGDALWPLVAICAYLACRPQELCNVRTADIADGTLSIRVSKTEAGKRLLPIPATLQPLVASLVRTSTDGWLLPGIRATGADGDRYTLLGKRASTVRKAIGIGESHPIYSLRHTGVTLMADAGIPKELRQRIVGHVGDGDVIDRNYDRSRRLVAMTDALSKITFGEDVDAYVRITGEGYKVTSKVRGRS
ncbi:DUF6538 domain-containing protein [Stenotrophomonas sp. PS02300]|uniref:DUF6538 domain-containing protein n=1 Tax=Stenotrophomonas sp. PS02300 TaxID=2991426 RepID=UPI00249B4772|nr:DUF6538 domain-containing protein [Stenotrophomonas sp. PS02300]